MIRKKVCVYASAALLFVWSFLPIYLILVASITPRLEFLTHGYAVIPRDVTSLNYRWIFQPLSISNGIFGVNFGVIRQAFFNSSILTVSSATIATALAVMAGYGLGMVRPGFRSPIVFIFFLAFSVPSISILLPYVTLLVQAGLLGTYAGVVITYLTLITPLATWIFAWYFATLPQEPQKAARIDGCTRLQIIRHIILPIARPGIAAVWLLSVVLTWNELLFSTLIGSNTVQLIQPTIYQFSGSGLSGTGSSIVVTSIVFPIVLTFFFQRQIKHLNLV